MCCRNRIVKENGLSSIEHYMFEEHELLRPAAVECMCNMVMSEQVCPTHAPIHAIAHAIVKA